jgi:hypothetical protein
MKWVNGDRWRGDDTIIRLEASRVTKTPWMKQSSRSKDKERHGNITRTINGNMGGRRWEAGYTARTERENGIRG